MDALFKTAFPRLVDVASKKTSERDERYNCIAWAFEDNQRFWWPSPKRAFWPVPCDGQTVKQAFDAWLSIDNWTPSDNAELEPRFKKIALYEKANVPTHAARLLPSGRWTSKLGPDIDLVHELNELEGPEYGVLVQVYKKATVTESS